MLKYSFLIFTLFLFFPKATTPDAVLLVLKLRTTKNLRIIIIDKMDQQHVQQKCSCSNKMKRKNKFMKRCCSYPCRLVSRMFRGFGRCVFVTCYPAVQCFGLDEHKHSHHRKHFDW
ncbi:hypothetical protein KIW84_052168 [Lathyrus oleraceus]|uniref:Secreted protein n=1 Tax=Pisum sativum TaxID=3888 RepID=A0A9D4WN08_PEA|nr:hypothetical protein KIW84_052168 [Pisum sativum]